MKIKRLEIENARSFKEKTILNFQDGINIFIGSNGGGKSNLMDIVNIIVGYFFIYPWREDRRENNGGLSYSIRERRDIFNPLEQQLDKNTDLEDKDQKISITLEVTKEDVENLKMIFSFKEKLTTFEGSRYKASHLVNLLQFNEQLEDYLGKEYVFDIVNYSLNVLNRDNFSTIFLQYLNYFEYISLLIEEYNKANSPKIDKQLYPVLLYFSPYRNSTIQSLRVKLAGQDIFNLRDNYKGNSSRSTSTILEYANFYFAAKLRRYKDNKDIFLKDREVSFINKYIKKLGYEYFDIRVVDEINNEYEILLHRDGKDIEVRKASSGEKEIINLLLGIFAFKVENGLVIIDEPELHLHPRWQKIFLTLFTELSKDFGIQFLVITHSPQFINYETIKNTHRVFKEDGMSKIFRPSAELVEKDETKDVFQIINSSNNERMFFADKVVLVEGIVDKIIFDKILRLLQEQKNNVETIEIIEVYGKHNFERFRNFLNNWKIKNFTIADVDYAKELDKKSTLSSLFQTNYRKMNQKVKEKGSTDRSALIEKLENSLLKDSTPVKEKLKGVKELLDYIKNRNSSLRKELTTKEQSLLNSFIRASSRKGIFLLSKGELEDYFNISHASIDDALAVGEDLKIIKDIPADLKSIFKKII